VAMTILSEPTQREVTVAPEDTLGESAEKLAAAGAETAVVLDFGRPIGTLTRRDLVHASAARVHPSEARVREWMSAELAAHDASFQPAVVQRTWPNPGASERRLCDLQYAAGRVEQCPGESCLYWVDDACILAPLKADIGSRPDLVAFLLSLRSRLGGAASNLFGLLPGLT